jgi:uncharacterized protein YndB with AHSA1/START domain
VQVLIAQTTQFTGLSPQRLYDAYLSSKEHAAMTADGALLATFHRPSKDEVAVGGVGDELWAFGVPGGEGKAQYSLNARVLELVPGKLIVLSWRNKVWDLALDPNDRTDLPSTVVLTFAANAAGAEIRLMQANVPHYKVSGPETGEVGSLSDIVNTHSSLLYWEPMRRYFGTP